MKQKASYPLLAVVIFVVLAALGSASCFIPTRHGVRVIGPPVPRHHIAPVIVPAPRVYVAPRPVYVPAPRVYVAPAPPPAVVYAPAPAYAPPPAAYAPPPAQPQPNQQVACIDPAERDVSDRFDQATPLAATSSTVACTYRGNVDVFVVTAPPANAGQLLRYSVRGYGQMTPVVEILDANRAPLSRLSGPTSGEVRGWAHVTGSSPIFIRVSQVHGVNEPYMLALESIALPEPGEPNGDIGRATPLPLGGAVQAFLSNAANDPSALADWYRVDVVPGRELSLDLDTSEGIAPQIEVFDANRRPLMRKGGARSQRIQVGGRVPPGAYFVRVSSTYSIPAAGDGDLPPWLVRPYTLYAR